MQFDQSAHPSLTTEQWNLLAQAAQDKAQLAELFNQHRDRLKRIVSSCLDQRVQGRLDASDVLQETFIEAYGRVHEYLAEPKVSLFVWLRFLAKQRLAMMHRQHLSVQARDVRRDRPLLWDEENRHSSVLLATQLAARLTTASATLSRKELRLQIQDALNKLDEKSREVLLLRHFEQLSNVETAEVLAISSTAACNRYVRALERLKHLLNAPEASDPC